MRIILPPTVGLCASGGGYKAVGHVRRGEAAAEVRQYAREQAQEQQSRCQLFIVDVDELQRGRQTASGHDK